MPNLGGPAGSLVLVLSLPSRNKTLTIAVKKHVVIRYYIFEVLPNFTVFS